MTSSNNRIRPHDVEFTPYTPISSLGRELAILFAFLALCFGAMGLYWFWWQAAQRREAEREAARLEALSNRRRALDEKKRQNERATIGRGNTDNLDIEEGVERASLGARNGTSAGGLGFGDREEDLVV